MRNIHFEVRETRAVKVVAESATDAAEIASAIFAGQTLEDDLYGYRTCAPQVIKLEVVNESFGE